MAFGLRTGHWWSQSSPVSPLRLWSCGAATTAPFSPVILGCTTQIKHTSRTGGHGILALLIVKYSVTQTNSFFLVSYYFKAMHVVTSSFKVVDMGFQCVVFFWNLGPDFRLRRQWDGAYKSRSVSNPIRQFNTAHTALLVQLEPFRNTSESIRQHFRRNGLEAWRLVSEKFAQEFSVYSAGGNVCFVNGRQMDRPS